VSAPFPVIDCYGREVKGHITVKLTRTVGGKRNVARIELPPGYLPMNPVVTFDPPAWPRNVVAVIDPETAKGPDLLEACERNLTAAAEMAFTGNSALYWWLVDDPVVKRARDRCYYNVEPAHDVNADPSELASALDRTGAWERVPHGLHHPPDYQVDRIGDPIPGTEHDPHMDITYPSAWECIGSWKTTRGGPTLQCTLWRRGGEYVAELDIDLESNVLKHLFREVIPNHLTGNKTHPYLANQAISWAWGIVPFRLEPGKKGLPEEIGGD